MQNSKCKICRKLTVKLFLKGDKCVSPKCPMAKKPYPPGQKRKRRVRARSEYGKELEEKQKLKNWYNLKERQFRKYVKETLKTRGRVEDATNLLIKKLESRFDNVVFRLGWASSRSQAHQLISHSHFLINGRRENIPSRQLKKGDKISIRPSSTKKTIFKNLSAALKKYNPPSWLELNREKLEAKVTGEPKIEEVVPPAEILTIFEFYSR